jgi:hypothetical protein
VAEALPAAADDSPCGFGQRTVLVDGVHQRAEDVLSQSTTAGISNQVVHHG